MSSNTEQEKNQEAGRRIWEIINRLKIERLGQPYSLLAPAPFHFSRFSKVEKLRTTAGWCNDPQIELLYDWGMPRNIMHALVTLPGAYYSDEFQDFSIELFGLYGEPSQDTVRLKERLVGKVRFANADPITLPMRAGLSFTASDELGNTFTIHAWRWRVFMNNSSLCLECLWHELSGWIPYVLGIKYDNPEKMVADAMRFAPAFRFCNLIDAELEKKRGGDRSSRFKWSDADCEELKRTGSDLLELWNYICDFFERNHYSRNCPNWIIEDEGFLANLKNYHSPSSLLLETVATRKNKRGDKYKPLAFALQHAWQIIGNGKPYSYSSLKKKYDKGAILMKQNRISHQNS